MPTQPPARPRRPAVTRAELEALEALVQQSAQDAAEGRRLAAQAATDAAATHALVQAMHGRLMVPQPGQERALLDRMAAVTIDIETGKRSAEALITAGKVLTAIGAIIAAFALVLKLGHFPPEGGAK